MLLQDTFSPKIESLFYFLQHGQPKLQFIERKTNIQFMKFSIFEQISEVDDWLEFFDFSCEEIFNEKEFLN